jgi:hypothetical protein
MPPRHVIGVDVLEHRSESRTLRVNAHLLVGFLAGDQCGAL